MRPSRPRRVATLVAVAILAGALPLAAAKKVFVTSASGTGNLGSWPQAGGHTGLAAGDAICRSLAADAGLADASLFRAWLSTSTTDAYCHVAGFAGKKSSNCGQPSLPDAGPWQRTDGVSFSHRLSDLTSTFDVLHPPLLDENGDVARVDSEHLHRDRSATAALDTRPGNATCNDWQSASAGLLAVTWSRLRRLRLPSGWTALLELEHCNQHPPPALFRSRHGWRAARRPGRQPGALGLRDLGLRDRRPRAAGPRPAAPPDCQRATRSAATSPPPGTCRPPRPTSPGSRWPARRPSTGITTDGPFRRPGGVQIAASKSGSAGLALTSNPTSKPTSCANTSTSSSPPAPTPGVKPDRRRLQRLDEHRASEHVSAWASPPLSSNNWTTGQPGDCDFADSHLLCFSNVVILFADGFESGDTAQWSSTTP